MCGERVSTRLFDALFYLMMDVKYKFNFNGEKVEYLDRRSSCCQWMMQRHQVQEITHISS